jgi:hypothetical protein
MTQAEQIDRIISKSAEYFGIAKEDLLRSTGTRAEVWKYKRYLIAILLNNFDITYGAVAKLLNYKKSQGVSYHYAKIKDELSDTMYGYDLVKKTYKQLTEHIGL